MGSDLSIKTLYRSELIPISQVTSLLAKETNVSRIAEFSKCVEAAKKIDTNNSERRNYWGELAIWSARRLGELIHRGQKDGKIAGKGQPKKVMSRDVTLLLKDVLGVDDQSQATTISARSSPFHNSVFF